MDILIISTGGTISMAHDDNDVAISDDKAYKGDFFTRMILKFKAQYNLDFISKVTSKTILNKDSSNINMDDWKLITNTIVENYDSFDAFIVTHGTDTMGYTTSALSYALGNLGKPVVFTGAQVSYGQIGTDSVMNLENVLRFLKHLPEAAGVFLVFGTQIISGTRVKKKTEFDYDSFRGTRRFTDIGTFGNTIDIKYPALDLHHSFLGSRTKKAIELDVRNNFESNIAVLSTFPGMNPEIIIKLAESGTKGFILRGYGDGDIDVSSNPDCKISLNAALKYLELNNIPVVITDQTPHGVASMSRYEMGVLGKQLGAIPAMDMSIEATVTKLAWLLGNGYSFSEIRELMEKSIRGEVSVRKN